MPFASAIPPTACLRMVLILIFSFGIVGLCDAGEITKKDARSTYRLGVGDVVGVVVYGEEDLSIEVPVSDGGTISYPFLGELEVVRLTAGELENKIAKGLRGPYLVDPKVNVTILEYRQFFIYGEVNKPGGYPYQPGLTLRRAIALTGGFTERASSRRIFVVHEDNSGQKPLRMELGAPVKPGDVLTVKESFF